MRSVGDHGGAASHASHLVVETAVKTPVPGINIDASVYALGGVVAMLPPFVLSEGFLYRICALQYTLQPFSAQRPSNRS